MATTQAQVTSDRGAEKEIRSLLDRWAVGARKGDLEAIMACYTPDVLAFDAIAALQFKGAEAYREHWEMCLSHLHPGTEMLLEMHEVGVAVSGDLAFAHYLSRCGGTDTEGNEHSMWMRATVCCRRTRDGWRIAHEHYSAPMDPETNKALELSP
jgi:uncharacterized protein (TIGR02246 family)